MKQIFQTLSKPMVWLLLRFSWILLRLLRWPLSILAMVLNVLVFRLSYQLSTSYPKIFGSLGKDLKGNEHWEFALGYLCDEFLKFHTEAIYWWRKAIKDGDSMAQYKLGDAYHRGTGVTQNDDQAILCWQTSVAHVPVANVKLALKYLSLGNDEQALKYLHEVIKFERSGEIRLLKNPLAYFKYQIGMIYKRQQNYQEAKKWLQEVTLDSVEEFDPNFLDQDQLSSRSRREINQFCRKAAQDALQDLAKQEERERAKLELEDLMAMFAHKFRGPLQSIEMLAENDAGILEKVRTMNNLLDVFSMISINPQRLRERLLKDRRGEGNLWSVLEKNLIATFAFLLSLQQRNKIRQHYLNCAKRLGQVPTETDLETWETEYLPLERQLQAHWENSFKGVTTIEQLSEWVKDKFFPIEIQGVAEATIHFEHYGVMESIWQIILFEVLLNAIKYYASDTQQPLKIRWQQDPQFCQFQIANPTTREEQLESKGSGKGHQFLSILAKKLEGQLSKHGTLDHYEVEFSIPTQLLMENDI